MSMWHDNALQAVRENLLDGTAKIYCYKDHKGWGKMFGLAFVTAGYNVNMFTEADQVPDESNVVYMMQHHNPRFRQHNKDITSKLALKENILMIPSHLENRLYDNKVGQYKELSAFMPKSFVFQDKSEAYEALENGFKLPFISKSSEGAASSNVDIINTKDQAILQIEQAFSEGIKRHYNLRQSGYLFWQEFLDGNEYSYKVIIIGNRFAFIFKKLNRPEIALASGSKDTVQITEINDEIKSVLQIGDTIAREHEFIFTGLDIIFDYKKQIPVLLETTTDWSVDCCIGCKVFEKSESGWIDTDKTINSGQDMFDLMPEIWGAKENE